MGVEDDSDEYQTRSPNIYFQNTPFLELISTKF